MKNKITILSCMLFLLIGITSIMSCSDDNDKEYFPDILKIVDLTWVAAEVIVITDNGTTDIFTPITDKSSLRYDNYAIRGIPEIGVESEGNGDPHFGVPSITNETIDSIIITSSADFNSNYSAGSNLADFFDVVAEPFSGGKINQSLNDFIDSTPFVPEQLSLILKVSPEVTTEHEFTVEYYQDGVDLTSKVFTLPPITIVAE